MRKLRLRDGVLSAFSVTGGGNVLTLAGASLVGVGGPEDSSKGRRGRGLSSRGGSSSAVWAAGWLMVDMLGSNGSKMPSFPLVLFLRCCRLTSQLNWDCSTPLVSRLVPAITELSRE